MYTIKEGGQITLCGKIVILDGIWSDQGITKADISILDRQNSKPITAGYQVGDEIKFKKGCVYYVNAIFKNGIGKPGEVILTEDNPPRMSGIIEKQFTLTINDNIDFGDTTAILKSIYADEGGLVEAKLSLEFNKIEAGSTFLKSGDIIWKHSKPYILKNINLQKNTLEFEIMENYYYSK